MKNVLMSPQQGWMQSVNHGWAKKVGLAVLSAGLGLALLTPTVSSAGPSAPVTQLEYIQVLVHACGDDGQFSSGATAADFVQWAKNKGMNPTGGWNPDAQLSPDVLAQTLVQLNNINPNKQGGNFRRILEREGINVPDGSVVTRASLFSLVDDSVFQSRMSIQSNTTGSPRKGNNGLGNGEDPPPPGWVKNHPGRQQNDDPASPGHPQNGHGKGRR
jgi:hypothetical protein